MDNTELIDKLQKEIEGLKRQFNHSKYYNIRNLTLKALIKSGIAIEYALPFILSSFIMSTFFQGDYVLFNPPFTKEYILDEPNVEMIDMSNGNHIKNISYDYSYDNSFSYSTGWALNDDGLYERTITSYTLDGLDLNDKDKIFSMTKEEIEDIVSIKDIHTIKKDKLDIGDRNYNSDALIIITNTKSPDDAIVREETTGENVKNSLLYIALFNLGAVPLCFLNRIAMRKTRAKLKEYALSFKKITREDLINLKELIEIKQENLDMLNDSDLLEDHSYILRKR